MPFVFLQRGDGHSCPLVLASSWSYDPRLVSGARPTGAATRTLTFGVDSATVVSDTGLQFTRRVAGGPAIPNLQNSMLTWTLAVAYARNGAAIIAQAILVPPGGH